MPAVVNRYTAASSLPATELGHDAPTLDFEYTPDLGACTKYPQHPNVGLCSITSRDANVQQIQYGQFDVNHCKQNGLGASADLFIER